MKVRGRSLASPSAALRSSGGRCCERADGAEPPRFGLAPRRRNSWGSGAVRASAGPWVRYELI